MIIGRKRELKLLEKAFQSKEAEFITLYGRRRVGKTYLIRQFFSTKDCHYFEATGYQHGSMKTQLESFTDALSESFFNKTPLKTPRDWKEAFDILHKQLLLVPEDKKIVIFLDELPWMATRRSSLMQAIDYYWNHYWSGIARIIFVICGSSASWLLQKIIYNKGGLHNRTTLQLELTPFTLYETKKFLVNKGVHLENQHILELYMALGGIPYYLKLVQPGMSAQQNIQLLFFDKKALLKDEFDKLFDSLFDGADAYKELVEIVSIKKEGIPRSELQKVATLSTGGGRLTKRLKDLCYTGFLEEYVPWGRTLGEYYKVTDEFCLFYAQWLYMKKGKRFTPNRWMLESQRPSYYAWAGYAFEAICLKHIDQIIASLGITSASSYGSWRFTPRQKNDGDGAQIDLVIDRLDNAITLCEIKYTGQPFAIDKQYAAKLNKVMSIFRSKTRIKKQIFFAMVSANGLKQTIYSEEMLSGVVTLDNLFKESSHFFEI